MGQQGAAVAADCRVMRQVLALGPASRYVRENSFTATPRYTGDCALSESESFINEVTEEVRRDQLYGYVRKYGWIAVLCVLVLVGGAAWNEYSKAQSRNAAQATGNALLEAMEVNDPATRAVALADISSEGQTVVLTALMTSGAQLEAGDIEAASATLMDVSQNPDLPMIYRELASFKSAILPTDDAAARKIVLNDLAQPGGSFALLAKEQLAYLDLEAGDVEAAITKFREIDNDAGVTRGLRERVQTMIVALGAEVDPTTATQ